MKKLKEIKSSYEKKMLRMLKKFSKKGCEYLYKEDF